jgi:dipeptidyl aminopeptidase/acylaminoacyl peptidase
MSAAQDIIFHILAFFAVIAGLFHSGQNLNLQKTVVSITNPLSIESLRSRSYPGSEIAIEETLPPAKTYTRYIASYKSDGLKIYALLLIPNGAKPKNGWPVIVLNHGYIIPDKYTPDGNYIPYADAFAKNGYLVFKPSYRGHGKSDGVPTSSYYSPDYIIDDLNAIASIKKYPDANPSRIGIWGHSMGGQIALKVGVIDKNIKAVSVWGGVVAPINEIMNNWQNRVSYKPDPLDLRLRNEGKDLLTAAYGNPATNPTFWNLADPNSYLKDIKIPIQVQVGLADNQVPPDFSKGLYQRLRLIGKTVEYFEYPGANHDINQSFSKAMGRTIDFFNRYLK